MTMSSTEWCPNPTLPILEFVSVLCNPRHHRSNEDLNRLSINERKRVFEDLAGSSPVQAEDIHEVIKALQEMEVELSNSTPNKEAFDLASKMSPDYVNDLSFRLIFLRGNEYDPKRAAEQVVLHFEEKLLLFGQEKLARDIKLSDLSADDMESLSSGGIQISNVKDHAGRTIIFFRFAECRFKQRENCCRASWYLMMAALEDEEVQRRGIVYVAYEVGDSPPRFDFELIRRELHKMKCIPIRVVGGHFCTSNPNMMKALDLIIHMSSPFFRVRIRAHYGIETEVLYQLMTFGIPVFSVPWVGGGDNNHKRWLEARQDREAEEDEDCMLLDESSV